jgi:dsDNA-binding SOS-regulon protein
MYVRSNASTMSNTTTEDASAWERTLSEADEMAEQLRAEGWEVVTVRAGHTAALPPERGEADRFGLVYVAPDDVAESLPAAVESGDLERSEAFRRREGSDLFLVTRVSDPGAEVAVLLVGAVDLTTAETTALATAAHERGRLHSHVELLDGTRLASFRHDHPADFLPER